MTERGVLCRDWKVRAILDGATQMRRPVKPQPEQFDDDSWSGGGYLRFKSRNGTVLCDAGLRGIRENYLHIASDAQHPHGKPGDALYVREAWRLPKTFDHMSPRAAYAEAAFFGWSGLPVFYEADGAALNFGILMPDMGADGVSGEWGKLRPSIHMPRKAVRIRLPVTGVRVERLQEISDFDAIAEGLYQVGHTGLQGWPLYSANPNADPSRHHEQGYHETFDTPEMCFAALWDPIYAKQGLGWDANPWVFVTEFERVTNE